jgi:hypothetical protein
VPDQITGLNSADRSLLRMVVKAELARIQSKSKTKRQPPEILPWYFAKLTSAMTAGTFEAPTTFTFTIHYPDPDEPSPAPLIASTDADDIDIEGANYFNVAAEVGTRLIVEFAFDEWTAAVDCP